MTTNFFSPPLFCCCFWIRDPGKVKIRIRDKHPGSATLLFFIIFQIENAKKFGVPVVVAINVFAFDSPAELELITRLSKAGAPSQETKFSDRLLTISPTKYCIYIIELRGPESKLTTKIRSFRCSCSKKRLVYSF
jgi:hypothetical protein